MSLRDKIRAVDDLVREKVHVPEWGVDLWVREMTSEERYRLSSLEGKNIPAHIVRMCIVDEDGAQVFEPGDDWLADKNGTVVERLAATVFRVNGLTSESAEELGKA